jgi:hypothetical protein
MAAPQSTPLPEAPQRGEPESVFIPKSNAFVASLEPLRQELQAQMDWADIKIVALDQAVTDAQTAQGAAETAQGLAEGARDAAQTAESGAVAAESGVRSFVGSYADTTAGLAATTDGQYFALDGAGHIYLNNAGVAEQITDYASLADGIGMISAALDAINGEVV